MKKYFLLILLVNLSFAQNKKIEYGITSDNPESYDKLINDGNFNDNGNLIKSFTIVFDGDIERFKNKLIIDLGNEDILSNHKISKTIYFRKFKKPEWGKMKYTIYFQSKSFEKRNVITFTCLDNKGNDCLNEPELKQKIKTYLENILSFAEKRENNEK